MSRRILLDTNVAMDFVDSSRPGHRAIIDLTKRCALIGDTELYVSISTLKDIYYVLCRAYRDEARAREDVRLLCGAFELVGFRPVHAALALESDEPDFEDGLIRALAEGDCFDAVLTRDVKAFKHTLVPHMSADQYLEMYRSWS